MEDLMEEIDLKHALPAVRWKSGSGKFTPPVVTTFEIMNLHSFVPNDTAVPDARRLRKSAHSLL